MVQKDLSEFYQTIQTDTAHVVADTATKVQDQIKVTVMQTFCKAIEWSAHNCRPTPN